MTLRQLCTMAEAKQQVDWDRTAVMMVNARLTMANPDKITVADLIPKRYQPKPPKLSPEQEKRAVDIGWTMFAVNMFRGKR